MQFPERVCERRHQEIGCICINILAGNKTMLIIHDLTLCVHSRRRSANDVSFVVAPGIWSGTRNKQTFERTGHIHGSYETDEGVYGKTKHNYIIMFRRTSIPFFFHFDSTYSSKHTNIIIAKLPKYNSLYVFRGHTRSYKTCIVVRPVQ